MCYLVNYGNVYEDTIFYSLYCYQTFFLEQFQKPGYDAIERAFTKVNMESFYCALILTYDRINYFQLICDFYLLMLTKYIGV